MHRATTSTAILIFALATGVAFAQSEVTGECKDGTVTKAQSREGACSSHGGVKSWQGPKASAAAQTPADATGQCNDGTFSTAASKSGACSGHKGVRDWYKDERSEKAGDKASKETAREDSGAKTSQTRASASERSDRAKGGGAGKVWVNTRSKVYHCENDRWYGKTKSGEYMSEADAKAAGNHPDHGKACST